MKTLSSRALSLATICGSIAIVSVACEAAPAGPSELDPPISASTGLGGLEYADVLDQGGTGIYAVDGSSIARQPNGLRVAMTIPTPQSGTYVYPAGTVAGHPEVFTLWAFVFNYPDNCSPPSCGADDLGTATGANGGVYNVGGHFAAGNSMTVVGRIGVGEPPRAFAPLESPGTAEIHVALAPHGAVDPSALPTEFRAPAGSPFCGCWWVAIFVP